MGGLSCLLPRFRAQERVVWLGDGKTRTDLVTCKAIATIPEPSREPEQRPSQTPVSISNSGPRSPSSRLDPNARANRRHPRARSQADDRRRSSRGYLARPPGDRLVITAPKKVLQTGSYDRAPLGPRDGEAFGPRSRTARLHDRLVITAGNRRFHSVNSSQLLFAPSSLSLKAKERGMATASADRAARGCREAPARSARPCSATASRSAGRAGAKRSPRPDSRAPALKGKERP